LGRKFTY